MNVPNIKLFIFAASIVFLGFACLPDDSKFANTKSASVKKDAKISSDQENTECYLLNEACDGADNNCNGEIDEGCPCLDAGYIYLEGTVRYCGGDFVGICRPGNKVCLNGQWTECQDIKGPEEEICDSLDNNCDGKIDENCPCEIGDNPTCGEKDIGECHKGWRYCLNGNWSECYDLVGPQEEVCDNLDNDCNGEIDEDLIQDCSNNCGQGTEICDQGEWKDCDAPLGDPEVCDDVDNDCDGSTDENLVHTCDLGCGIGTEKCEHGKWINCTAKKPEVICKNYTNCKDEKKCSGFSCPAAPAEVCDDVDNDCDGSTDEDFPDKKQTCAVGVGECKNSGVYVCKANKSSTECSVKAKSAQTEICDNKDNDCDSKTDEDNPDSGGECNVLNQKGECLKGILNCQNGALVCTQTIFSTGELCDDLDNDCDGKTDEIFSNKDQSCDVGLGECKNVGVYVCKADQKDVECSVKAKNSTAEICDNKDNDCDGWTDEDLTQTCSTACGVGKETCYKGTWVNCNAPKPISEYCDNKDNDCDGQTDEDVADCYPVICVNKSSGFSCFSGKCLFKLDGSSYISVSGTDIFSCASQSFSAPSTMNIVFDYKASAGSCWNEPYLYIGAGVDYKFFYFPDCYSSGTGTISINISAGMTVNDLKFELHSGDWGASVKIKEITFN